MSRSNHTKISATERLPIIGTSTANVAGGAGTGAPAPSASASATVAADEELDVDALLGARSALSACYIGAIRSKVELLEAIHGDQPEAPSPASA